MQSNIDPTTIDTNFPVIDNNQPSQGFRTNFSSIKDGLVTAKSEITNLQTTYIQVTGDVISDPNNNQPLGQEEGIIKLNLSLNLSDANNGYGGSYDSQKNRITYDYTSTGLLKNINVSDTGIYTIFDTSSEINFTLNQQDSQNPSFTGISSLTIPSIITDTFGNVTSTSYKTINFSGILGYDIPVNSVLIGSSSGKTTSLTPESDGEILIRRNNILTFDKIGIEDLSNVSGTPSNNQILVFNGTNWIPSTYGGGTVVSISAGQGLKILNPNTNAEIDFDYTSLSSSGVLSSSDIFVIYDGENYKISTIEEIYNFINSSYTIDFSELTENDLKILDDIDLVVYNKLNKTSYRLPAADIFNNYAYSIFVSNSGDDVNGDGSIINPYKTISKAVSSLGGNNTIVLFPGTYTEIIQISNITVTITSMISNTGIIKGSIIQTSTDSLNLTLKNISLETNNSTIMTFVGGGAYITIDNCNIQNYDPFNTITTSGNISNFEVKNSYITGVLNLSHNGTTIIKNITSNNYVGIGFIVNYTQDENNIVDYTIDNIDYVSEIQHASGNLYVSNIANFVNSKTFTSSSSVSTDILYIKNVNGSLITNSGRSYITFSKSGSCSYYIENFDINYDSNLSLSGYPICLKNNQWQYDYVENYDNDGQDNIYINAYAKTVIVSMSSNGNISINSPNDTEFRLEMCLILVGAGATSITFSNISWIPNTPIINYTSGYQNIITLTYIPGNSFWIGFSSSNSNIGISSDSSNLITTASDGLLVSSNISKSTIFSNSVNFNGESNSINISKISTDVPGSCGTSVPNTLWVDINYLSKSSAENNYALKSDLTNEINRAENQESLLLPKNAGVGTNLTSINTFTLEAPSAGNSNRNINFTADSNRLWIIQADGDPTDQSTGAASLTISAYDDNHNDAIAIAIDRLSRVATFNVSPVFPSPPWNDNSKKGATTEYVMNTITGTYITNNIKISSDPNNLLQNTSGGLMVELVAPPSVAVQYISSSSGSDTTGDGSQDNPFATIHYALSRVPDYTSSTIYLKSGDTFHVYDGQPQYVENGTVSQVTSSTFAIGNRNIFFSLYGSPTYQAASNAGVSGGGVDIGNEQPIIEFIYSYTSDKSTYSCPGFNVNSAGSISFYQINLKINGKNLPTTSGNLVASYSTPIIPNSGTITFQSCNLELTYAPVMGSITSGTSTSTVVIQGCYFDTTNGQNFSIGQPGYRLNAPFNDVASAPITQNGTDTGFTRRAANFNNSIANSSSFVGLSIIDANARIYQGLYTTNLLSA